MFIFKCKHFYGTIKWWCCCFCSILMMLVIVQQVQQSNIEILLEGTTMSKNMMHVHNKQLLSLFLNFWMHLLENPFSIFKLLFFYHSSIHPWSLVYASMTGGRLPMSMSMFHSYFFIICLFLRCFTLWCDGNGFLWKIVFYCCALCVPSIKFMM